jgi:fucose permease
MAADPPTLARLAASTRILLWLCYVGFVSLGLPDTVLGAAWPALRRELGLPLDAAGALLLVTTLGVVISSAASGWLLARSSTGAILIGSTLLAASALLATGLAQHWSHVLTAALLAGLGGGAIDATLNGYVARHYDARQLSFLHAFWGVGAALAPLVVASALSLGWSWRLAYGALALLEALLALAFFRTLALWREGTQSSAKGSSDAAERLRWPMLASVALFYLYGGLEAGTGLWTSSVLTSMRGFSEASGGAATALFWGALTLGRFAIGLRADRLGPVRVLGAATFAAVLAAGLLALPGTPDWFACAALTGLGLALAPIYPLAMHDTENRFGARWGPRLIGYQVAAASSGVATLPWLLGAVAERTSMALLPCALTLLALALTLLQRARRQ